jgi:hypothetical protein
VDRKIRYRRWRELYRLLEVMDSIRRGGNRAFQCGVMESWSGSEIRKTSEVRKPSGMETTSRKDRVPGNHAERKNAEVSEEKTMFQRTRVELIRLSTQ